METTSITRTETCQDNKTTVITDTIDDKTVTTTCIDNKTTTKTSNKTLNDPKVIRCPCHRLNLQKLLEETRCQAFKSSNRAAARADGVLLFALQILQNILICKCKQEEVNINDLFLIATAMGEIGDIISIYNPPPFNS